MLEKLFADKRVKFVEISDLSKFAVRNTGYYEKDYFIIEGSTIEEALENAYNKLREFK